LGDGPNTYAYVGNNPLGFYDPNGLWSLSVDAYWGVGGGLALGQDPNGSWWASWNAGAGFGGGFGFDPDDTSPAYDSCYQTTGDDGSFGVFSKAEVALVASLGAEAKAGIAPQYGSETSQGSGIYNPTWYANASWTDGFALKKKLSAFVAFGIEGTFYGNSSGSGNDNCECSR
jgi:uncharacterized protein RhaS with RHS repeats